MNDAALFYALADRLDRIERLVSQICDNGDVAELWLSKKELAQRLGVSVRWIDYRIAEGLPRREIAGRLVFRLPTVEGWLRTRGLLERQPGERPGGAVNAPGPAHGGQIQWTP